MYCKTISAAIVGVQAKEIRVEVDISQGLPIFEMVGLLSSEVREARERVRTAIKNTGLDLPPRRITVNLSPADVRKMGNYFDLPMAVAILCGLGAVPPGLLERSVMVGELGLDGQIGRVNGILPIVAMARQGGYEYCFVPQSNAREGGIYEGIQVIAVASLEQMIRLLTGEEPLEPEVENLEERIARHHQKESMDILDVAGQETAKRGMKIAMAGMHNLLLAGPPGSGKTMLAKRIPSILPRLGKEECLEVSQIYSVAGLLGEQGLMMDRPFRETHHLSTVHAMLGGGASPHPGEITLAHKGILFLDEFPEFPRQVMEALRQPMEDREVVLSRVKYRYRMPADFVLVAAMNLCPCGQFPDRGRCRCTDYEIHRYLSKISGPLMDRIDIGLVMDRQLPSQSRSDRKGQSSAEIRKEIEAAHAIQMRRYHGTDIQFNSRLNPGDLPHYCQMEPQASRLLDLVSEKMGLSLRAYHKLIKVSRTIADLEQSHEIQEAHMAEAVSFHVGELQDLVPMRIGGAR